MSQAEHLLRLFQSNGNRLTLGQILGAWHIVGSKYTNRLSDLRKMGYAVTCTQNRDYPTENIYTIEKIEPGTYAEPSGQLAFVIR